MKMKIDKENHFATPTRRKNPRQSSTPLSDRGNLNHRERNEKRRKVSTSTVSPTMSPISVNFRGDIYVEPSTAIFPIKFAPTLPTFEVEYSPMHRIAANCDEIPAKRLRLDFMDLSYEFKPATASTSSPLSTPLVGRKFNNENKIAVNISNDSSECSMSMNSSEVGDKTLQKMIDSILESARHGKKFSKRTTVTKPPPPELLQPPTRPPPPPPTINIRDRNANFMANIDEMCAMEQKSIERLLSPSKIAQAAEKTIIIADDAAGNEREVKSPVKVIEDEENEIFQLKRQNAVRRKNACNQDKIQKKLLLKTDEESHCHKTEKEFQDSTIQKCLSFSSANFDDLSDKFKRSSVASNSSSSSNSCVSQSKFTKNLLMKGSLEVAVKTEDHPNKKIIVHVIKCKNLERSESSQINAYVKCALVSTNSHQNEYQRTAVHKSSNDPIFDHKFHFNIQDYNDYAKHIQIAVWHRNRDIKRSEFLGCLMIPVKVAIKRDINGYFLLQPQISLNAPSLLIPEGGLTINDEDAIDNFYRL